MQRRQFLNGLLLGSVGILPGVGLSASELFPLVTDILDAPLYLLENPCRIRRFAHPPGLTLEEQIEYVRALDDPSCLTLEEQIAYVRALDDPNCNLT